MDSLLLVALASALLALLVYFMWIAATKKGWAKLTKEEKKRWKRHGKKKEK